MIALTTEQLDAANGVYTKAIQTGLGTLGGYAGTGKSTILAYLQEQLDGWMFMAYTGKASHNLRKRGVQAKTIHSVIYTVHDDCFELKHPNALSSVRGFAIDEGSMVGTQLLADIKTFGKPIIVVGDHGQLPPVNDGAGLMVSPDYTLERIHRNAGPIAEFAEWLRNGEPASEWRSDSDKVQIVNPSCVTLDMMMDQVITAFNTDRREINKRIRERLGYKQPLVIGERIIVLKNNRKFGVFNGQQGIVTGIDARDRTKYPVITLDTGHRFPYHMDQYGDYHIVPIDYAYCLSCHKAQGDEFDSVIVFEPRQCDLWKHTQWTYTAASRARERLTWVLQ